MLENEFGNPFGSKSNFPSLSLVIVIFFLFLSSGDAVQTEAHRWAEARRGQTWAAGEKPTMDSVGKLM